MVKIRTDLEMLELKIAAVSCLGLFIGNWNIWPMRYSADVPSTMMTLISVLILHHIRVENMSPLIKSWRIYVDILLIYICNQIVIALFWETLCYGLYMLQDSITSNELGRNLLRHQDGVFVFLKINAVYVMKWIVVIAITLLTIMWTNCLDYLLPWRRSSTFFANPMDSDMPPPPPPPPSSQPGRKKAARTRSASNKRARTRSKSARRRNR